MLNPLPDSEWTPQAAAHLLNRAAFGGTPEEIQKLHALGHRGAVEALLGAGEELDLFPAPEMEPISVRLHALKKEKLGDAEFKERKKAELDKGREKSVELRQWWLRRMRETTNPAREKATLFWHGHWASGKPKVKDPFHLHRQNETLRANALGPFAPFAKQISRDPVMIEYLDLQSSTAKNPNENFAREVMELFMLGEGHYSEADIAEAARAFTGYRVSRETGRFEFRARQNDSENKTFLGKTGPLTADDVIDLIVEKPRCSEFLAGKIWTFYAGTKPSDALQQALGNEYRRTGMDTGKLLRIIFTSHEFFCPECRSPSNQEPRPMARAVVQDARDSDARSEAVPCHSCESWPKTLRAPECERLGRRSGVDQLLHTARPLQRRRKSRSRWRRPEAKHRQNSSTRPLARANRRLDRVATLPSSDASGSPRAHAHLHCRKRILRFCPPRSPAPPHVHP